MKSFIQRIIQKTANSPLCWLGYQLIGIPAYYLSLPYRYALRFRHVPNPKIAACIDQLFPDLKVKNGPFKGMRYPTAQATGSALLPKLLGSYESELYPIINNMLKKEYTDIVDVGSAEGYYAIGFGMRFPKAKVYAFEANEAGRHTCEEMAKINGITDRLQLGGFCDDKTLLSLSLKNKALIISDCEGYEKNLLTPEVAHFLKSHDLLVEIHDLMDTEIASSLRLRFEKTHRIQVVESIDDYKKSATAAISRIKIIRFRNAIFDFIRTTLFHHGMVLYDPSKLMLLMDMIQERQFP